LITSEEVKSTAREVGFVASGIIAEERFGLLPVGPVFDVQILFSPRDVLPNASSVIVLGYEIWDPVFNIVTTRRDVLNDYVPSTLR
jgi:hypothetical protein